MRDLFHIRPCFSSLFFHQTYAGARKKNKMPKEKKHWLSVPDYLTDKRHTELIVLSAVILLFIFYQTMIQLNSFQSPRKFEFSWYLTSLRGQRTWCSNLQPKRSSTLRMHSSCPDRSLHGKLDRGLDSRPNTYPDAFVKARPHYYQQSLRSIISTERILAFGFHWPDSVTRLLLLPPNSRKRALRCVQSFGECAWMASTMLFRIMVSDVHPIIYLHPTTEKEKVPLPLRNNREEIATSTQSSLQVQRASVARFDTDGQQLWVCDPQFFFFQPKATRAGDEKHRKKSTWPNLACLSACRIEFCSRSDLTRQVGSFIITMSMRVYSPLSPVCSKWRSLPVAYAEPSSSVLTATPRSAASTSDLIKACECKKWECFEHLMPELAIEWLKMTKAWIR